MQAIKQLTDNMRNRVRMMVATGIVKLIYPLGDPSGDLQKLQMTLLVGETRDKMEHWLPYGFAQHPHPESEGVVLFPDGDRSHGLVIGVADRRYRLKLTKVGEIAIYDDLEQKVHLTRDGIIVETSKNLDLTGKKVKINGEFIINDEPYLKHHHTGVESGGSITGDVAWFSSQTFLSGYYKGDF